MSKTHSVTSSNTGSLAISAISPLFVNRFGCFLLFSHLEFAKEAIYDDDSPIIFCLELVVGN